jgi:hypothetical protein
MRSPRPSQRDYPQPFDNVTPTSCTGCLAKYAIRKYRYDQRSPDWVGLALAKHLGLDPRADRKKLNAKPRALYANSVLAPEIQRRVAPRAESMAPRNWTDDRDAA